MKTSKEFNDYLTAALEKRWASLRRRKCTSKNLLDPSHLKCEFTSL